MLAAKLVSRCVSALTLIYISLACLIVGDVTLTLFSPDVAIAIVAVPMIVTGAGMGLAAGLVDGQALEQVDPAKAGMAAGFLNTLRLGSEAIAVAVYGSTLATVLSSDIGDSIGAHAGAGNASEVASQTAGDYLARAAQASGATDVQGFLDFLTQAYGSAFHTVLWGLAVACLILHRRLRAAARRQPAGTAGRVTGSTRRTSRHPCSPVRRTPSSRLRPARFWYGPDIASPLA